MFLLESLLLLICLAAWTIGENTALEVNEYVVQSDRIPEAFSGFRIAQVSDLHNAQFGENNSQLIELLSQTDPDIIFIDRALCCITHLHPSKSKSASSNRGCRYTVRLP